MSLLVACFLAMIDGPVYKAEDFYCHDESGNAVALKLRPKIYLKNDKLIFAQLSNFEGIIGFDDKKFVEFADVDYEKNVLSVLNSFPKEASPVIVWKGQECVPINSIVIEIKEVVDVNLLKERLVNFGKFNITELSEVSPRIYRLSVSDLEMPTNIFVLANLISEDSIYMKWARPIFQFVYDPIQVSMYITSGGLDSLGSKRFLHLDVYIFDEKITLLKDLVPQLGEGEFTLGDEDIWFWTDKPVITETKNETVRTISFVWPFIYLNTGDFTFKEILIPYSRIDGAEKTEETISTGKCKFQIGSVTKGVDPSINDIQPMHDYIASSPNLDSVILSNIDNWKGLRPVLAVVVFGLAVVIFCRYSTTQKEKSFITVKKDLYLDELVSLLDQSDEINWKERYKNIELKLRIVLVNLLNFEAGIESQTFFDHP